MCIKLVGISSVCLIDGDMENQASMPPAGLIVVAGRGASGVEGSQDSPHRVQTLWRSSLSANDLQRMKERSDRDQEG